ncbi:regulator of chromosome condensation 1/beta-lactamase-inhibitor protein II [Phaeosphaeriaceae sp. PMI808]|nr:regulator of chromosome condensation 1/beta-lactamase-inhibitor protein II [Phaeosphaeriaceae sp. PMI808]
MSNQLYVFGSNGEGQLGIPVAEIVAMPTLVPRPPPLEGLKSITGGDNHTLFVTCHGEVYGVGDNRKGQLVAQGEQDSHLKTFKKLADGVTFAAATCESSAFIVVKKAVAQSSIYTRGSGQWGELGLGDDITSAPAVAGEQSHYISTLPGTVIDFAAGVWHYVAVLDDGSVYGWGKARLGQLGQQVSSKVTSPTRIEGIPFTPVRVICGKDFTYLVGCPSTGEHIVLGKNKFNIVSGMAHNISGWKDIAATWHAIFVLLGDGKLIAWGRDALWDLVPPGLPLLDTISIGSEHVLAVTKTGGLISWGWGKHGNCGDLSKVQKSIKNDMVCGFWNEISIPEEVKFIGTGFCTSFVING